MSKQTLNKDVRFVNGHWYAYAKERVLGPFTFERQAANALRDELKEIARGNVERHLGDVCEGEDSADSIYDEVYTLAFDALHDAGVPDETARSIAKELAMDHAAP